MDVLLAVSSTSASVCVQYSRFCSRLLVRIKAKVSVAVIRLSLLKIGRKSNSIFNAYVPQCAKMRK